MTDSEKIDLLVELFGWEQADKHARFEALRILRRARNEPDPNFDDFAAGIWR